MRGQLSDCEIEALQFIAGGANVYGHQTAKVLWAIDQKFPGALIIRAPRDENPRRAQRARFFAELTSDGREAIEV